MSAPLSLIEGQSSGSLERPAGGGTDLEVGSEALGDTLDFVEAVDEDVRRSSALAGSRVGWGCSKWGRVSGGGGAKGGEDKPARGGRSEVGTRLGLRWWDWTREIMIVKVGEGREGKKEARGQKQQKDDVGQRGAKRRVRALASDRWGSTRDWIAACQRMGDQGAKKEKREVY